jgi:putative colanic acid biosysnthesis UDP-glucose lipid carrier transferase
LTQPVVVGNSFAVALIAALQLVVPSAVAVGCLYAVVFAYGGLAAGANVHVLALFVALLTLFFLRPQRDNNGSQLLGVWPHAGAVVARWGVILAILLAVGYATKAAEVYSRLAMTTWALVTGPALAIVTVVLDRTMMGLLSDPSNARRTVMVGINDLSLQLARQLARRNRFGMILEGFFDDRSADRLRVEEEGVRLLGGLKDLAAYANTRGIQVIFIALPMRHLLRVRELLDDLRDTTASIYYVPDIFVFDLIQARSSEIFGIPVVALCETPFYGQRGVAKRLTDVVISATLLLLVSPVMIVVAWLVKLSSPGPVIFRQRRYGLDGHEIIIYKFRTMRVTEDGGRIVQATKDDNRVTAVGRFLRRYSLDELPQLINVLQGRMSLVGPRPHAVAHNEEYRRLIKGYMVRHKVRPGITGLAQINGCRGETTQLHEMQARVEFDLDYLRRWSLSLDLKILFMTVLKLLSDDKAY